MSAPRRLLIIGTGKRVRETALPALASLGSAFDIRSVFARRAKEIEVGGRTLDVRAFSTLERSHLDDVDLVYMAVTKDAVPQVLETLDGMAPRQIDLLIDTPVVRFRHFHRVRHLEAFRAAWVAEDCSRLPWFDAVRAVADELGELREIVFDRSAYAYHGLATAKSLLGTTAIASCRRRPVAGGAERTVLFKDGRRARILEPRDYSVGSVTAVGQKGALTDSSAPADGALRLTPWIDGTDCRGFRAGEREVALDPAETDLMRGDAADASVTARMDSMKRVGFRRLLQDIEAGRGAYPVEEALDDTVVDYHLEKAGRYFANPLTSSRSASGRFFLRTLTRLGG